MNNQTGTILLICIGSNMAIGYYLGEKYLSSEIGLGAGLVLGIILATFLNFYLNKPKKYQKYQNEKTYPQDNFKL